MNLSIKQIDDVANTMKSYVQFLQRDEINQRNINCITSLISLPKRDAEGNLAFEDALNYAPLIAMIDGNMELTVSGTSHKGTDANGREEWLVELKSTLFCVHLEWFVSSDVVDGTVIEDVTVTVPWDDGLYGEQIDCVRLTFSKAATEIADHIVFSGEFALVDTPCQPAIISESFEFAKTFFNTFDQMSDYYHITATIRSGDHTFDSTYIVEAQNDIEAQLRLLQYLESSPFSITEFGGEYYGATGDKCYEGFSCMALPQMLFEQLKTKHVVVHNSDLTMPDHQLGEGIYISSTGTGKEQAAPFIDFGLKAVTAEDANAIGLDVDVLANKLVMLDTDNRGDHTSVALTRYTVHLPVFEFFSSLTKGNKLDAPRLGQLSADESTIVFDCVKTPEVTDWLHRYVGISQQTSIASIVVLHNGGHRPE